MSNVTSICGTPRGAGRNPVEDELAERAVVARHLALALEHVDLDLRLAVGRGREHLAALGRDRGVLLDQLRHHVAERLDAERERRHVEQQHVLHVAREHAALHRGADRHHLIGVHGAVRLAAEQRAHLLLHHRDPRAAADQHDLLDVRRLVAGVLERLLARPEAAVDEVLDQLLELRARELHREVLRTALIRRDVGQIDVGRRRARQLDLRLLGRLAQPLHRHRVLREVDALVLLELRDQVLDDALVEVVAAEVRVAVGRLHLDDVLAHLEDRDVERAAAEVVDGDLLVGLLVEAVGERRRRSAR
jgi:hypothetical protein